MQMTTTSFSEFDQQCMRRALELARLGASQDEVPVGAVLVDNSSMQIIGEGYNQPITSNDPTAHAEIIAMRSAGVSKQNYRLVDTTLYVTLEPCSMCAGAMLHARIKRLVFACVDPKAGAVGGAMNLFDSAHWNHKVACEQGLLAEPCRTVLQQFFQARR
jgi:tRNA(adenine34) deaminase